MGPGLHSRAPCPSLGLTPASHQLLRLSGKRFLRFSQTPSPRCKLLTQLVISVRLLPAQEVMSWARAGLQRVWEKGRARGSFVRNNSASPKPASPHLSSVTAIVTASEGGPSLNPTAAKSQGQMEEGLCVRGGVLPCGVCVFLKHNNKWTPLPSLSPLPTEHISLAVNGRDFPCSGRSSLARISRCPGARERL